MPSDPRKLKIGTRGSALALTQANWVADRLRALSAGCELVVIKTSGDVASQLNQAGDGKGLFVKEIEQALLAGEIHLAVHSLKDLPGDLPAGLHLAAVPPRESPFDALCCRAGIPMPAPSQEELPSAGQGSPALQLAGGAVVGTASIRRQAQLRAARPDLQIGELRGNLDTRLRRLDEGKFDAIVVAAAGLRRMGWERRISQLLPAEICLPAFGQGALALEARVDDKETNALLAGLDDRASHQEALAERALLQGLGGGCQVPAAGLAIIENGDLWLRGAVISPDGERLIRDETRGLAAQAEALGRELSAQLLARGAGEIVAAVRR